MSSLKFHPVFSILILYSSILTTNLLASPFNSFDQLDLLSVNVTTDVSTQDTPSNITTDVTIDVTTNVTTQETVSNVTNSTDPIVTTDPPMEPAPNNSLIINAGAQEKPLKPDLILSQIKTTPNPASASHHFPGSSSGITLDSKHCGTKLILSSPNRQTKIVGGHPTYHGQYPWVVSIRLANRGQRHHCGGTLIAPQWVLTAAHCVSGFSPEDLMVRIGGHTRSTDRETGAIDLETQMLVAHEGFSFSSFHNDIALIKLNHAIQYSNYIQPICLPQKEDSYVGKKATVIGWGRMSQSGFPAQTLQGVELPILSNSECQSWYEKTGREINLMGSQFCAGLLEGGKDACQGDSGGPLMIKDETRVVLAGVVSAGIGCALPQLPGLYTRVHSFMPWLMENMSRLSKVELNVNNVTRNNN